MATVKTLVDAIKAQLREPFEMEISIDQVVTFINNAADDAGGAGWMIPIEDDESLTYTNATTPLAVPATFAWVREIRYGSNYDSLIPRHYWDIRINSSAPTFFWHTALSTTPAGALKVVGYKRPKNDYATTLTETVDPGMDAFLRSRAMFHALQFLSTRGTAEEDTFRQAQVAGQFNVSENIMNAYLQRLQETKVVPASRYVAGR